MASTRLLYDNCNNNYYCNTTGKIGNYMTSQDQATNNSKCYPNNNLINNRKNYKNINIENSILNINTPNTKCGKSMGEIRKEINSNDLEQFSDCNSKLFKKFDESYTRQTPNIHNRSKSTLNLTISDIYYGNNLDYFNRGVIPSCLNTPKNNQNIPQNACFIYNDNQALSGINSRLEAKKLYDDEIQKYKNLEYMNVDNNNSNSNNIF